MKCRACFVSNSSSCSSIVFLPDDFKPDWEAYEDLMEEYGTTKEDCQEVYDTLLSEGSIYEEEHNSECSILSEMFRKNDMVIAGVDCSSDAGQIVLADKEKIKKLINKEK